MLRITIFSCLLVAGSATFLDFLFGGSRVINGVPCSENQVIRLLRVSWNGTLEFECGPIPCGEFGTNCVDNQKQCRAEDDYFLSRMRAAPSNQNLLLRCCHLQSKMKKLYVGTEEIFISYYEGGEVAAKNRYIQNGGAEYDFIANARAEPAGVRIWVYRLICDKGEERVEIISTTTAAPEQTNSVVEEEEASGEVERNNEVVIMKLPPYRPSLFLKQSA